MQVNRAVWWALIRLGAVVVIALVGPVVATTSPVVRRPEGILWALLAVSLTVAAAAVFAGGLAWWSEFRSVVTVAARAVAPQVLALASLGILLASAPSALMADVSWRGAALVSTAIVGAMPVAFVLFGIRSGLASRDHASNAASLEHVLRLRPLAQRQLTALGALVALATLALGASFRAAADSEPPETILIFGLSGSAGVALVYLPAHTALRKVSESLVDAMFPIVDGAEPATLLEIAEKRQTLRDVLGLDGNVVRELQANIAVLAPLMAGGVDLLL